MPKARRGHRSTIDLPYAQSGRWRLDETVVPRRRDGDGEAFHATGSRGSETEVVARAQPSRGSPPSKIAGSDAGGWPLHRQGVPGSM